MNVLENVTYQTCKSFAYFNSLLVVANFSVKKKKMSVSHQSFAIQQFKTTA